MANKIVLIVILVNNLICLNTTLLALNLKNSQRKI